MLEEHSVSEIELPGTNVRSTKLGFGCGQLFRVGSAMQRQRLLGAAFDIGIRHFDVARMYGLGRTERELGKFAARKRDQIVIATKFGIEPVPGLSRIAAVQQLGRAAIRWLPAIRSLVRKKTPQLYQRKSFSPVDAQRSLETSLSELNTDYVDVLLLHEPARSDTITDDLYDWLEVTRSKGVIRAYGLAGEFNEVRALAEERQRPQLVLQFPNDVLNRNFESMGEGTSAITYSPFTTALGTISRWLSANPVIANDWKLQIQLNVLDNDVLASLLLKYCVTRNRYGVTLFSTSRPERITNYAQTTYKTVSCEQVEIFVDLLGRAFVA